MGIYLEGSTDLAILQAFASRLGKYDAARALERPFVHYVGNHPPAAARHFHGIKEALPDLQGVALFDRLEGGVPDNPSFRHLVWQKREIENYLCTERTLLAYACASAKNSVPGPLFIDAETERRTSAMREALSDVGRALDTLGKGSPWSSELKSSDEFLTPLFEAYFRKIDLPNLMAKKNFYELADLVPDDEINPEIGEKLDALAAVAASASPATHE